MILALLTFFNLNQPVGPNIDVVSTQGVTIIPTITNSAIFNTDTLMAWYTTNISLGATGRQWAYILTESPNKAIISATALTPSIATINSTGLVSYVSPGIASFRLVVEDSVTAQQFGYRYRSDMTITNPSYTRASNWISNQPNTLSYHVWTNMLARTNGTTKDIWSQRAYTIATRSNFTRNPNCMLKDFPSLTAISQLTDTVVDGFGSPSFTAITRRHAFTRGHGLGAVSGGPAITNMEYAGKNIVFVGASNEIVTAECGERVTVEGGVPGAGITGDFTLVIFSNDLPACITPMKVINIGVMASKYPIYNTAGVLNSFLPVRTQRDGFLDTKIEPVYPTSPGYFSWLGPNFTTSPVRGGDSGSPNMIMVGSDLAQYGGTTTSGPANDYTQDVLNYLSIHQGLDPSLYQLQYVDVSSYPTYPP